jgi:hypothetical protein
MNRRRLLVASLLLAVFLAACVSPMPAGAPTDAPAATVAAPTLIYFHATW